MSLHRRVILGLAYLTLAACLGSSSAWAGDRNANLAATDPLSNMNRLPDTLEQTVGLLRADLQANGFAVARGYWTLWGVNDCKYPIQVIGYCYGNNPVAPYVLAVVPPWKDEYLDQSVHHLLNEPLRSMSAIYRLDQREALVIVAQLPPPARYFGIQSNVFTREIALNPQDRIFAKVSDPLLQGILFGVSPDPSRVMLVASVGNSTNNIVIERQTKRDPWNQPAYIVITSDADMAAAMTTALIKAGASPSEIFTEPVSPALVHVGLNRSADDLITYIRYSMPDDPIAGEQWRRDLPLTILRVRDMSSREYDNPFPIPAYEQRAANFNENDLIDDFKALQAAVVTRWAPSETTIIPFFSAYKFLDLIGQHCLGYPADPTRGAMDCLGDTQDADYQISLSGQLDNGEVIALIGVLSRATGNATYTSLSVNWFPQLVGVANIDDNELAGTAASFAGVLKHDPGMFYVYYVARDCTGLENCREVPTQLVANGEIIKFIQRNYINPGSRNGPNPEMILNPIAISMRGIAR